MAEKDITGKILMSYADVFSDCINVFVYEGKQRLNAENTRPAPTESFYRREKQHNQFCDVSRYLLEEESIIAQYMIENEMQLREKQVLRKISYQGGAYRQQLESGEPAYAVVGIVMAWTGKTERIPLSLHKLLSKNGVPSEELAHTDDAELTVYHMNNLSAEVRKRFVSDMGFVADYLNEGTFESRREQKIVHLEALCDMMEVLTGDTRFTEQAEELIKKTEKKEEGIMMCEYINMLEARGEERGLAIGEARGEKRGEDKLSLLLNQLFELGREEEARLAVRDTKAREELYKEFQIGTPAPEGKSKIITEK